MTRDEMERMELWELIRLLRGVKLKPSDRALILEADKVGAFAISRDDVARIRKISRANFQKLADLQQARDLARLNPARIQAGMKPVRWGELGKQDSSKEDGFGI